MAGGAAVGRCRRSSRSATPGACFRPPPSDELVREMMAFLACGAGRRRRRARCSSRTSTSTAPTPAPSRGATRSPTTCATTRTSIVIGCGESGLLAGIRLAQAGLPFTIIEKNGGPGGTWWENRYPGARVDIGSHFYCYSFEPADHWTEYFSQHPELRAYFERVMNAHELEQHCRFEHARRGRRPTTTRPAVGRSTITNSRRRHRGARRPRGDQRGRRAQHAAHARHPRHGRLRGSVVPLRRVGTTRSTTAVSGSRWSAPARAGFQIAPTIADDVEQLTVYQRTAQWMFPNPNYHRAVPDGDRWAIRHLPFYGRWFRFLTFYPGAGLAMERSPHRPRVRRRRARDQRDQPGHPRAVRARSCGRSSAATPSSRRR